MINFEVLKENLNQLQLVQDHYECRVPFYDHGQQFQAEQGHWIWIGKDRAVVWEKFLQDEFVDALSCLVVFFAVVNFIIA